MLTIILILFLVIVIAVVATTVLALGAVLSHVFAVSTFQASIVVLAVAVGVLFWLGAGVPVSDPADGSALEEPAVIFSSFPLPPRQVRRRRKR